MRLIEIGAGHTVLSGPHQTVSPASDGNDARLVPSWGNICHDRKQTKPSPVAPTQ